MSITGLPDGIISKPKIPIWVNFRVSCNGCCWYFHGLLVYFMVILYIFPVLVCCMKEYLATLVNKMNRDKMDSSFPRFSPAFIRPQRDCRCRPHCHSDDTLCPNDRADHQPPPKTDLSNFIPAVQILRDQGPMF
jgi:hypothetical protein